MTSQYGAKASRDGLARLYSHMGMHAHTRKHARTDQYVIIIAFPQQRWFLESACVTLYINCLSCIRLLVGLLKFEEIGLTTHNRLDDSGIGSRCEQMVFSSPYSVRLLCNGNRDTYPG
jgi:hypothetical protein